jgi:hypothetical protein
LIMVGNLSAADYVKVDSLDTGVGLVQSFDEETGITKAAALNKLIHKLEDSGVDESDVTQINFFEYKGALPLDDPHQKYKVQICYQKRSPCLNVPIDEICTTTKTCVKSSAHVFYPFNNDLDATLRDMRTLVEGYNAVRNSCGLFGYETYFRIRFARKIAAYPDRITHYYFEYFVVKDTTGN